MIHDRHHAGKLLAEKLTSLIKDKDYVILAVPRGGVIVGDEIARRLGLSLDVIIAKKITPPDYQEYGVGAVTYDGVIYCSQEWQRYICEPRFVQEIDKKKNEVARQIQAYRGNTDYDFSKNKVILVDDGIATGSTICAILQWLSQRNVKNIILAVPVMPYITYEILKRFGVQIVALEIPLEFSAVAQFYRKFEQVPEQIVLNILQKYKSK
jgi:predicted phosphoribosyltransferase